MKRKHVEANMMNLARNILIAVLVLCSASTICLAQAKRESPIVAVITDDKGLSTTVTGLLAHYTNSETVSVTNTLGQITGTVSKYNDFELPTLCMRITEGHTTFSEDIPFSQIKKIEVENLGVRIPKRILIEKKDGSNILIAEDSKTRDGTFEERDSQGNLKRQLKVTYVDFKLPDDRSSLTKFVGRATVTGSREGDFSLHPVYIRSIVFQ